jgi:uncharacterized protein (DUF2267 family)
MNTNVALDESLFTRLVRDRGLGDERRAHRAIMATLEALGARVPAPEREALARALPLKLARAVSAERFRGTGSAADLYAAVVRSERVHGGFAHEHVQIVLVALGELLPEELVTRLERAVAPSIAELLAGAPRAASEPAPHRTSSSARHHTLATGKPGSRHPVSESPPPPPQSESVAAQNPHADTKLSSAHGETQERERESLSTSHPRTARTIAESRD